jgi:signal transduction histidine kinase
MANIITRSSQRMYKLITDLLEVAAQEAGKSQLEKSFVNLSELPHQRSGRKSTQCKS